MMRRRGNLSNTYNKAILTANHNPLATKMASLNKQHQTKQLPGSHSYLPTLHHLRNSVKEAQKPKMRSLQTTQI